VLFPHVVNTQADKVFVNVLNDQAATADAGDSLCWDTSSPDGVRSTQPTTAALSLFVGIVDAPIAASAYGLVQAYGYRASALITNNTSVSCLAGDILIPVNAVDYLARSAASDGKTGFVFNAVTITTATTPAAALGGVFIRAL
jgi:hypothetical protein